MKLFKGEKVTEKSRYEEIDFKSFIVNGHRGTKIRKWWIGLLWLLISLTAISRAIQLFNINNSHLIGDLIGYMLIPSITLATLAYHSYYSCGNRLLWLSQALTPLFFFAVTAKLFTIYREGWTLFAPTLLKLVATVLFMIWSGHLISLNGIISKQLKEAAN